MRFSLTKTRGVKVEDVSVGLLSFNCEVSRELVSVCSINESVCHYSL